MSTTTNIFRVWRDELGFDTATAAKRLGKTQRMVQLYDKGHAPPLETLKLMAAVAARGGRDIEPYGHK